MRTTLITARLTLATPGGVTAPERITEEGAGPRQRNVLPLRRDPLGDLQIPGTSIAGALKRYCRGRPDLSGVFGSDPGADLRTPSAVQVLGCVLLSAATVETRARTAVARDRGAAAARTLHAVEQLPAETAFELVLRWNDSEPGQLDALLEALKSWTPTLGRGTSTGAGYCMVTHLSHTTYDLATTDGLADWLALPTTDPRARPTPEPLTTDTPRPVHRAVRFTIVDGLHVGTGVPQRLGDRDLAPVVRRGSRVIVPGTSIKGVLRARAEYICTRCGVAACAGSAPPTCVADRPCLPCRLYGRAAKKGETTGGRRAAVAFLDAVIDDQKVEHRTHVALDRFTGGSRPQLLYTDEVVVAGTFILTVAALDRPLDTAETALLDATIADLDAGLIGLGARTTAGYGTVRIADPRWAAPDLTALADVLRSDAA